MHTIQVLRLKVKVTLSNKCLFVDYLLQIVNKFVTVMGFHLNCIFIELIGKVTHHSCLQFEDQGHI